MDLGDLRDEVQGRGFDFDFDVDNTRVDRWINRGYHRICDRHPWTFLETTTTGTGTVTITDLRAVYSVVDLTQDTALPYADIRTLREIDPGLDLQGQPEVWYMSDEDTIAIYPVNSATSLSVRYIKVPTDLSASSDTPIIPSRYHYLIVEAAVAYAYRDTDNFEAAGLVEDEFEKGLLEMGDAILTPNFDSPTDMVSYSSTDWGTWSGW